MITKDNDQELKRLLRAMHRTGKKRWENPTAENIAAYEKAVEAYKVRRRWVVEQQKWNLSVVIFHFGTKEISRNICLTIGSEQTNLHPIPIVIFFKSDKIFISVYNE